MQGSGPHKNVFLFRYTTEKMTMNAVFYISETICGNYTVMSRIYIARLKAYKCMLNLLRFAEN